MSVLRVNELKAIKAKEENEKNRLLVLQAVRLKRMEEARRKKRPHQKVKIIEKEVSRNNRGKKRRINHNKKKVQKQNAQPKAIEMLDQIAWNQAVAHGGIYTPGKFDLDKQELERFNNQSKEAGLKRRGGHKRSGPKRLKRFKDGDEADWWSPLLAMGGKLAVDVLPKILAGVGDYEEEPGILAKSQVPESNSYVAAATQGEQGTKTPVVHSDGQTIRVANREYLGDVYSTTDKFSTVTFPINPGMNEWGPWGSPIANQYTNYTMLGAVAQFVTEASDYANVAGLGYVALGTQYNALAPVFADKREMLNSLYSDAVKPSLSMTHCIECDPTVVRDSDLFVRAGDVPSDADPRLYDLGRLTLAVGGNTAAAAVLGELWISYDVLLHIPKMTGSSAVNNIFYSAVASGVAPNIPFGVGAPSVNSRSTFRMSPAANVLAWPQHLRGDFMVEVFWICSGSINGATPPTATLTNCSFTSNSPVVDNNPGFSTTGATSVGYRNCVTVNSDGAFLTFTNGTGAYANGPTTAEITVLQIPKAVSVSPIFDLGGLNYDIRYDAFMDQFRKSDDKFSDTTFVVEKEAGDFALMVKEADTNSRNYGACYLKQKSVNVKTALPMKVAPWLRSMPEKVFISTCVEILKIPLHSQFFFDDVIHACCSAKDSSRIKKEQNFSAHHYDNAYFDEKDAPLPNFAGRVRYPPMYKNDHSTETSDPSSGYSENYKKKVAKTRPYSGIVIEEDGDSSSE